MWVFYDTVQAGSSRSVHLRKLSDYRYKHLFDILKDFKSHFSLRLKLSVNLRNTVELSIVLSLIREHWRDLKSEQTNLPEQKLGHVLRGTKPVIYILREDNLRTAMNILEKELSEFCGSDCFLDETDIAVIPYTSKDFAKVIYDVLMKYGVRVMSQLDLMSVEWPVVLGLYRFTEGGKIPFPDGTMKFEGHGVLTSNFYVALSRARVYSSIILYNYAPNRCEDTDRLLSQLRQHRYVCRIVDV